MSLISIVIPAYKAADLISETLLSVRSQTHKNWECWVIDDESPDNIASIVGKLGNNDPRIRYARQQNTGQGGARNTGIRKSIGEYIALLDADDIWLPTKLEKQLQVFQDYPEVDIVYTGAEHFQEGHLAIEQPHAWLKGKWKGKDMLQKLFIESGIPNSSLLIRKTVLEEIGLYDESDSLRGTEDWDLLMRLAYGGATFFGMEEPLLRYRIHSGGIHLNSVRMLQGKLAVIQKYDADSRIPEWKKVRNYRIFLRELMNQFAYQKDYPSYKESFSLLIQKDKRGTITRIQHFLFPHISMAFFQWISQKILYRIGFRVEQLWYPQKGKI